MGRKLGDARWFITLVLASSLLGALFAGWAGGRPHLLFDFSRFSDSDAVAFFGAWAQVILAIAVWFQIRSSNDAVAETRRAAAARERDRAGDAVMRFVGHASNAAALYIDSRRKLRTVLRHPGDLDAVRAAEDDLASVNVVRQRAYASLFEVESLVGDGSPAHVACASLMDAIDRLKTAGADITGWGRQVHPGPATGQPPDEQRTFVDVGPLRRACIEEARALRSGS